MMMPSKDMICNKYDTACALLFYLQKYFFTYSPQHFSIILSIISIFSPPLLSIFTNFITYFFCQKYILTYKQDKKSYILCTFYSKLYGSPTSLILVGSYSEWILKCIGEYKDICTNVLFPSCHAFLVCDKTRVAEDYRNALGLVPIFCLNALENTSASLYPTISAICLIGSAVVCRSREALFILTPSR